MKNTSINNNTYNNIFSLITKNIFCSLPNWHELGYSWVGKIFSDALKFYTKENSKDQRDFNSYHIEDLVREGIKLSTIAVQLNMPIGYTKYINDFGMLLSPAFKLSCKFIVFYFSDFSRINLSMSQRAGNRPNFKIFFEKAGEFFCEAAAKTIKSASQAKQDLAFEKPEVSKQNFFSYFWQNFNFLWGAKGAFEAGMLVPCKTLINMLPLELSSSNSLEGYFLSTLTIGALKGSLFIFTNREIQNFADYISNNLAIDNKDGYQTFASEDYSNHDFEGRCFSYWNRYCYDEDCYYDNLNC